MAPITRDASDCTDRLYTSSSIFIVSMYCLVYFRLPPNFNKDWTVRIDQIVTKNLASFPYYEFISTVFLFNNNLWKSIQD